jgi:soluble lytic murein transglycosylase-like protein
VLCMTSCLLLVVLLLAPAAHAEFAVLRSGQRLHISGYEERGEWMRLHIAGGFVDVRAEEVVAIEPEEVFAPAQTAAPEVPFGREIRTAAALHGVDERLIISVIRAESNFNPRAVSRKSARGLMQLMPATAAQYEVRNVFDPAENIHAGTRYLRAMLDRFGDLPLALAAYNAGPERVARHRGIPPIAETQAYVRRVLRDFTALTRETLSSE